MCVYLYTELLKLSLSLVLSWSCQSFNLYNSLEEVLARSQESERMCHVVCCIMIFTFRAKKPNRILSLLLYLFTQI